jgi:TIR domain
LKVFISWSGSVSQEVALALRDWLPSVLQAIEPYVSSEDIDKGARWSSEIGQELEKSNFGILCITPDNTEAPWVHFEAGALSKSLDRSRVVPFLFGLKRPQLPQGPLIQFQSVLADAQDVRRLLLSLNGACDERAVDENLLPEIFEVWWPRLQQKLASIDTTGAAAAKPRRSNDEVLAEVLELVRVQQQRLSDPTALLPPEYVRELVLANQRHLAPRPTPGAMRQLESGWLSLVESAKDPNVPDEVKDAVLQLEKPINYLLGRYGPRRYTDLSDRPVRRDLRRRVRERRDDAEQEEAIEAEVERQEAIQAEVEREEAIEAEVDQDQE